MILRGTGYIRPGPQTARQLAAHYRYLLFRLHAPGEKRRLFSHDQDGFGYQQAIALILAMRTSRVAYHKFFLSPSPTERQAILHSSWEEWTRTVMNDLAHRKRLTLTWTGVVHTNTAHHHVHIVLAGGGLTADQTKETVLMTRRDYAFVVDTGRERCNADRLEADVEQDDSLALLQSVLTQEQARHSALIAEQERARSQEWER
jgi:hypothetical protein